jgi:hypothetical protein
MHLRRLSSGIRLGVQRPGGEPVHLQSGERDIEKGTRDGFGSAGEEAELTNW